MGRKRKLSAKVIEDYCAAREIGATQTVAALYAGVSAPSIIAWTKRGNELRELLESGEKISDDDKIYLAFLNKVDESDASAAIAWLEVVNKAAAIEPNWAWRLLRNRYPDDYSEVTKSEVKTTEEIIIVSGIDPEKL